jgi:hypothetical protein
VQVLSTTRRTARATFRPRDDRSLVRSAVYKPSRSAESIRLDRVDERALVSDLTNSS